jgi:hypothetical protein
MPFFASFASPTKTTTSSKLACVRHLIIGHRTRSLTHALSLSVFHFAVVAYSFWLLFVDKRTRDTHVEKKERKKKVDSHSFSNLHSVHMRQTTRHDRNDFHCFVNRHDGKLSSIKTRVIRLRTFISFMASYCLFCLCGRKIELMSDYAYAYDYYKKREE